MTLYYSLSDPVKCTRAQKLKTPERLEHLVIFPLLNCTTQYTELNSGHELREKPLDIEGVCVTHYLVKIIFINWNPCYDHSLE